MIIDHRPWQRLHDDIITMMTTMVRGKFWVMGGSTGDDSYDHTITDKVQAYRW